MVFLRVGNQRRANLTSLFGGSLVGLTHLILGTFMKILGLDWGPAVLMGSLRAGFQRWTELGLDVGVSAVGKVYVRI